MVRKNRPPALTANDAARLVAPGSRVFVGGALAEPAPVLDAVAADASLWRDVVLTGVMVPGFNKRDLSAIGMHTRVELVVPTPEMSPGSNVHLMPIHYSAFARRLGTAGLVQWAFFATAMPEGDVVDLGPTADFLPVLAEAGVKLVAVVNPALPAMRNGVRLPLERLEAIVEADAWFPPFTASGTDATNRAIASFVVENVRDGATIEIGIGKLQGALFEALKGRRGLGLHAGMISPPILPLIDAGVFSQGITTGFAIGDKMSIEAMAQRDDIRFAPVTETHYAGPLSRIECFVAVNSALEVDLWGQANVERAGGRVVGGVGGLMDFMHGARRSPGGVSILALPATARGGSVSRIVPLLGGPVSVARHDVDIVVTEFGSADLRGVSDAERARRLTAIAAPDFRDTLWRDWQAG